LKKGDLFVTTSNPNFEEIYRNKILVAEEVTASHIVAIGFDWHEEDIDIKATENLLNSKYKRITVKNENAKTLREFLEKKGIEII
jgi:hypothetical protein